MSLGTVRTLIIDDDVYKATAIERVLRGLGVRQIETVSDQASGLDYLHSCQEEDKPLGLIITDMHYPLERGKGEEPEAGHKLLDRLEEEQISIPVIICSTARCRDDRALGAVWYSDNRDLLWQ